MPDQKSSASQKKKAEDKPVVIRKYANRRLYNTRISCYVTLDDLCSMVKDGVEFVVADAKTGEDITKSVLTQIIFEQESKGENLLSVDFLRNVIKFYDDSLKNVLPDYLTTMMQAFIQNQEEMRQYLQSSTNQNLAMIQPLEQMFRNIWGERNMEFFKNAFGMFAPFNPINNFNQDQTKDKKK